MKSHLKVKLYTLTTEMSYIRRQEEKWKAKAKAARAKQKSDDYANLNFWTNRWHRKDLKQIARTTHLAHCALKGIPYATIEYICYGAFVLFDDETQKNLYKGYNCSPPDWASISETVERFTRDEPNKAEIMQRFGEWLADAKTWYNDNPTRIAVFNSDESKAARALEAAIRKAARKIARDARENEVDAPDWAKASPIGPEGEVA